MTNQVKDTTVLEPKLSRSHRREVTKNRLTKFGLGIVRYALLIGLGFLILSPIFSMISTTLKHPRELGSPVSVWIPATISNEHAVMAYETLNYAKTLPYTFLTISLQALLQIFSAALAGYSFARLPFKGQKFLFAGVILTIIVPAQAISLPQYLNFRFFDIFGIVEAVRGNSLNLLGSPIGLYMLAFFGQGLKSGLYIYIFRQGFRSLPRELEESAFVDGSGYIRTFFTIVLPNLSATILTVGVLAFVWNWNDHYFVNLFGVGQQNLMVRFTSASSKMDQTLQTTSRALPAIGDNFELLLKNPLYQQAVADAMSLLVVLPLIIGYLLVQNRFVQSAERSGIVG